MKQWFKCSNLDCDGRTRTFGDELIIEIYQELEKTNKFTKNNLGKNEKVYCNMCGCEMIYNARL